MAKKFKKSAVLGSQIAPSGNGSVTGGYQPKNDFFGPSLVLTPLTSLETLTNLWKHLAKCQYLTQDRDSTKNWPFWRVFSSWNDHILWLGTGGKLTFCLFFKIPLFCLFLPTRNHVEMVQYLKILLPQSTNSIKMVIHDWSKARGQTLKIKFFTPFLQLMEVKPRAKKTLKRVHFWCYLCPG